MAPRRCMRTPSPTCSRGRQPAHAVAGIPDYGKKIEVSKFPYGQPLSKTAYERRDLAFCSCPRYAKGHSLLFNLPISIFLPDSSIVADMDILIGYRSALEYWRLVGPGFLRGYQERRTATRRATKALSCPSKPRLAQGNRRRPDASCPFAQSSAQPKPERLQRAWSAISGRACRQAPLSMQDRDFLSARRSSASCKWLAR